MAGLRTAGRSIFGNPYLLLVLTAVMWAGNAVAGRMVVGEISPMAVTSLRWVLVVALLSLFARERVLSEWRAILPYWRSLFAMGALGFTGFNALYYVAAHYTTAVNLGIIQGTMPVLVMVGSLAAYGIPIKPIQIVGMAVSLFGVLIVASRGEFAVIRSLAFNIGDVVMLFASLLYAGYTVALRRRPPVSGITFFAAMAVAAFLTSLPLLGYEVLAGTVQWPTPKGWAILLFIAILPSLTSQLLYMRGVELIGPGRAGLFVNLVPVFAALMGVAILGETFAAYHALALVLVLGGIWIAERGRR